MIMIMIIMILIMIIKLIITMIITITIKIINNTNKKKKKKNTKIIIIIVLLSILFTCDSGFSYSSSWGFSCPVNIFIHCNTFLLNPFLYSSNSSFSNSILFISFNCFKTVLFPDSPEPLIYMDACICRYMYTYI